MISVCIATYNGERFIERQIISILNQLGSEDEIVIADDGSTDNTLAILKRLNDSRLRVVEGAHRHSPIWNFERALEQAKGEYIFLADQDDVWMPEKVAVTMNYLQKYDCVVSDNMTLPQTTPHNHLRLRVFRPYRRHIRMPLLRREFIHSLTH